MRRKIIALVLLLSLLIPYNSAWALTITEDEVLNEQVRGGVDSGSTVDTAPPVEIPDIDRDDFRDPTTAKESKEGEIEPLVDSGWHNKDVSLTLTDAGDAPATSTDGCSGVEFMEYKIGSGAWTKYTAPVPVSATSTILIRAKDRAGNYSDQETININIDKVAPTSATINLDKTLSNLSVTATIVNGTDSGGSGVALTQFQIKSRGTASDDASWQTYSSPIVTANEGEYTIYARTKDNAGNYGPISSKDFTIDKTPPTLPNLDGSVNDDTITLPPSADGIYSWAKVPEGSSAPTTGFTDVTGDAITISEEGRWHVYIRLTDAANNYSQSQPITVIVDRTAPTAPSITPSATITNQNINVSITPGTDSVSYVRDTEYRIKDIATDTVTTDWTLYTTPFDLVDENKYMIESRTTDNKGNVSDIANVEVEIDRTAPELPNIDQSIDKETSENIDISVPSTDATYTYSYAVLPHNSGVPSIFDPLVGETISITNEGHWDVWIQIIDRAGNETIENIMTVMIDRTAPTTPVITPSSNLTNQDITIGITPGTDSLSGVDATYVNINDAGWTLHTGDLTLTDEGVYTIKVKTVDKIGNESMIAVETVEKDITPPPFPTFTAPPRYTNQNITLNFSNIETDAAVEYKLSNEASYVTLSGTSLQLTDEKDYSFYLRITDLAGNVTEGHQFDTTLDKTKPTDSVIKFLSGDDEVFDLTNTQPYLTVTPGADSLSGVKETRYEINGDGNWNAYTTPIQLTEDGLYNVKVITEDMCGNYSEVGSTIEIDRTPPTPPELPTDFDPEDQNKIEIPITQEPNTTYYWQYVTQGTAASDNWTTLAKDTPISLTEEGHWDIYLKATDTAGNVTNVGPWTVMIDRTAPTTPIINYSEVTRRSLFFITNQKLEVTITPGTDLVSGVKETLYRIDNGEWKEWKDKPILLDIDGEYNIETKTVDNFNLESNVATALLEIDTIPPVAPTIPEDIVLEDKDEVTIAPGDMDEPDVEYSYQIKNHGEDHDDTWSPIVDGKVTITEEGWFDVYIKAEDNASNGTISGPYTAYIDRTAPNTPEIIVNGESKKDFSEKEYINSDVAITLTPNTTGELRPLELKYKENGNAEEVYTSEITYNDDGTYSIVAKAVDVLGNESPEALYTFERDTVAPPLPQIDDSFATEDQNEIIIPIPNHETSSSYQWQYVEADTAVSPDNWKDLNSDSISITEEGIWDVYVRAVDLAKNESLAGPIKIMIDRTPPTDPSITVNSTSDEFAPYYNSDVTISVTEGTDSISGINRTEIDINGEGYEQYKKELTFKDDGQYDISVRTYDNLSNVSSIVTTTFYIDTTVPSLPDIDGTFDSEDTNEVIIPKLPTEAGVNYYYQVVTTKTAPTDSWSTLTSDISVTEEGIWDVYIRAVDLAGNVTTIGPCTIMIDRTAPTAPTIDIVDPKARAIFNKHKKAVVTDGVDAISGVDHSMSSVNAGAFETYVEPYELSTDGKYTIKAYTVDKLGNVSATTTSEMVEIDTTPPLPPQIDEDGSVLEDQNEGTIPIPPPGVDEEETLYSWQKVEHGTDRSNNWFAVENDVISITEEGVWDIYIRATDLAMNETIVGPYVMTIDRTAPNTPTVKPSKRLHNDDITTVIIDGEDTISGVDRTEYAIKFIDMDGVVNNPESLKPYTEELVAKAEGKYTLYARSVDKLGNASEFESVDLRIDKTKPYVPPIEGGESNSDVEIPLPPKDELEGAKDVEKFYAYAILPKGEDLEDEKLEVLESDKLVIEDEGIWNVYVTVMDEIGNRGDITKTDVTVDKTAPTAPTTNVPNEVYEPVEVVITMGTDNLTGVKELTYSLKKNDEVIANNLPYDKPIKIEEKGSYTLSAKNVDGVGNVSKEMAVPISYTDKPTPGGGGSGGGGGGIYIPSKPNPGNPSGGKDRDGNDLYLKPNINVNELALKNGYIGGYSDKTFRPNDNTTRAEFTSILNRIIVLSAEYKTNPFSDITGHWAYEDIISLYRMNIVPYHGNRYMPDSNITREHVAIALDSILDLSSYKGATLSDSKNEAVLRCYKAGIINGYEDGTFRPSEPITRAEMVSMINRVFGLNLVNETKVNKFIDMDINHWAYMEVLKATK